MNFRDGYLRNDNSQYLCTWSKEDDSRYKSLIGNDLFHHTFLTDRGNTFFRRVASTFHCVVQFPASTFPVSFTRCIFSNVERRTRETMYYLRNTTRSYLDRSMFRSSKRVTRRYIFFFPMKTSRVYEDGRAATEEEDRDQETSN